MEEEYSNKDLWPRVSVYEFTFSNIFEQIMLDQEHGNKVVVALTASTNYGFGTSQLQFFQKLQQFFPQTIIDIMPVGHCMYGCDSCSIKEHKYPLFFTRFINGTLPYTTEEIKQQYITSQLPGRDPDNKDNVVISLLLCPSIGDTNIVCHSDVVTSLIELKTKAESFFFGENVTFVFALKLHGFCFYQETSESVHLLHSLTALEKQNFALLQKHFLVVDERHANILPFFEVFDMIITDLNSSVPFEALYFTHLKILAFATPSYLSEKTSDEDIEYRECLHVFQNANELNELLKLAVEKKLPPTKDGRNFFISKYGKPDGEEFLHIAKARNWNSTDKIEVNKQEEKSSLQEKLRSELFVMDEDDLDSPIFDYLVRNLEIPEKLLVYQNFLILHKNQLEVLKVPRNLWSKTFKKLQGQVFDVGQLVQFVRIEGHHNSKIKLQLTQSGKAESDIFLVDHAWTTTPEEAKKQLLQMPSLLQRMLTLMEIDILDGSTLESLAEEVWKGLWEYALSYRIHDARNIDSPEGIPVWFVMDEVGSRISHYEEVGYDECNFRCVPFIYGGEGITYSLIWPCSDYDAGEILCRDFMEGIVGKFAREIKGLAYGFKASEETWEHCYQLLVEKRQKLIDIVPPEISPLSETVPDVEVPNSSDKSVPLKVFTDIDFLKPVLTWEEFVIVDSVEESDVIFLSSDFKDFGSVKSTQLINQFPNEQCVSFKNLLIETIERTWGKECHEWLPVSYNLNTELPLFVAHFQEKEKELENSGDDLVKNCWITKPWNKARGLEIIVTHNMPCIIRSIETGPKVVSEYITNPGLYGGCKFDLRYIVCLRSVDPLDVYVYKMFWIRVANKEFSLENFDNYEKHFTVMNYSNEFKLQQIHFEDFIKTFEKETLNNRGKKWEEIQEQINVMFKKVFIAATQESKSEWSSLIPEGTENTNQFRGIYGMDVMIDNDTLSPYLIEVNFSPDCHRAVDYDADFYNVVFSALFLENW
eukprot:CAMPEP_0174265858 /NCGR_PEP_ID=MMETSP0439-20130205/28188_1 /TAXON_ID=0 /ORGANISM="Stereomyxa ramosa, Strain Chinc5" /LENGTH=985 /DNA_ID=CAMNT_0015352529 /DNA_START=62 /DNA_END=3016 /DNA_ORIENTATION=+